MNDSEVMKNSRRVNPSSRHYRARMLKDRLARYFVGAGGVGVIIAIALIFFYLLYVVIPLFESADQKTAAQYTPEKKVGSSIYLAMEEQTEVGVRLTDQGVVQFIKTATGQKIHEKRLPVPQNEKVTAVGYSQPSKAMVAMGLANGHAIITQHAYRITYPGNKRLITPLLKFPLGDKPVKIDEQGKALVKIAFQTGDEESTLVALTEDKRLVMVNFIREGDEEEDDEESASLTPTVYTLPVPKHAVDFILLDKNQRNLYLVSRQGELTYLDVSDKAEVSQLQTIQHMVSNAEISIVEFLTGDISILVGDSKGNISQWALVPDKKLGTILKQLRSFNGFMKGAITGIAPEYGRKGFIAVDNQGYMGLFHTTAHRNLLVNRVSEQPISRVAVSPRANALLVEDKAGKLQFIKVHNEHPEISWQSLWGKVWYESYEKPEYVWQSSSADDDFEPKFSLTPITFGTLKAAFYAMLIAIPLAIFGALYTAQFMQPRMRKSVKPAIEIMEALPTVILGFLAGLWLAPYVESNLPGIFSLLILMPLGILFASFSWQKMPSKVRYAIPDGWEAALLLPVVALVAWFSIGMSPVMESWWFGGDMRMWLTNELGVGFDQRNAIVVGLAMGFAVIPTIFSIAEDAIFGVPKHLTNGSLALGATPWQTLIRVVLPSASPGIFSGVMIGLGRAVGETMIVLMATGNTPVMDFSPFEGLRTLSANIAVELPESEVDSTHFRVLFLAGLVLFMFTFIVNTIAEIVRQRLRRKYSSL